VGIPHFLENRYIAPFSLNRLSGLFHNKIHLLWNRPESLFIKGLLTMLQPLLWNRPESLFRKGLLIMLQPLISFPVASE
jgi:hypothetical protein